MKPQLKFVLLMGLLAIVWACKKADPAPSPTIVGYWVGKYGNGSAAATMDYAFLFRADGSMKVYANNADTSKASKASGTYFISGTSVNGSFVYTGNIKYSMTAVADEKFTVLSGTWGSGTTTTGNTFFLNKR